MKVSLGQPWNDNARCSMHCTVWSRGIWAFSLLRMLSSKDSFPPLKIVLGVQWGALVRISEGSDVGDRMTLEGMAGGCLVVLWKGEARKECLRYIYQMPGFLLRYKIRYDHDQWCSREDVDL